MLRLFGVPQKAARGSKIGFGIEAPLLRGSWVSYKAQQWVLEQQDVHGSDKFVLFMLAYRDNHDDPHGCWPSINRIASDCGLNRSTVRRAVYRLIDAGKIKVLSRRSQDGDSETNYYYLPQVWVGADSTHPVGAHSTHPGAQSTGGGGTMHRGVGRTMHP